MRLEDIASYLPLDWYPMDVTTSKYEMFEIEKGTEEYRKISEKFQGKHNMGPIFRIQNPLLFTKFYMKTLEYRLRGDYDILTLYHDSAQANVESIVTYNIDWRYGERFKYGPGVYFSTSSFRANKRANQDLGTDRAMFLVNVLVGRKQVARSGEFFPDFGYDTVVSPDAETYVKYFDHEYYPTYVQYYTSV
ncbi:hypothetical protein WA026_010267 [Henosepilachna vigintioctopunctata]|uniref:PARP catalytic domain-containing protein n=1 Tax=Henosepilachna vigintioctopunctata TaxID=420089 RepID=A0AAW1UBK3_9CUCU